MDSFESIIKTIFESKGYWVKTSLKVDLTKEEKVKIGRPSSPRWEIDVVAYKGGEKEILAIECKSFLDSTGVKVEGLTDVEHSEKYKLFNEPELRSVVLNRLLQQLSDAGSCSADSTVKLCLATGKIYSNKDRDILIELFNVQGWNLYSDKWVKDELICLSESGYENEIATVATKILMR